MISLISVFVLLSCQSTEEEKSTIINASKEKGREAAAIYEESRERIDPTHRILYNLAYSYIEDGDFTSSLAVVKEGEEKFPRYIRFDYLEAYIYRETGLIERYFDKLKEIIEKDPGNKEIREMLIKSLSDFSRDEEAETEAKKLLDRDPRNTTALSVLALTSPFFASISNQGYINISEDEEKDHPRELPSFDEIFKERIQKDEGEENEESEEARIAPGESTSYQPN